MFIKKQVFIIMISQLCVFAQPASNPYLNNPLAGLIEEGLKSYVDLKPRGLDRAFSTWRAKIVDADAIRSAEVTLGNYLGYDIAWWENISNHNCLAFVSLNYDAGPILLTFHGYKSFETWQIYSITLVKNMSELIELCQLSGLSLPLLSKGDDKANLTSKELSRTLKALQVEVSKLSQAIKSLNVPDKDVLLDTLKHSNIGDSVETNGKNPKNQATSKSGARP